MNEQLKTIMDFILQNEAISAEEKSMLAKEVKKVSSDLEIALFKLERTEKVKRTTAILLEETIEELEQKRKAVEKQNRELEIESSLERVRTVAMGMRKKDDMLEVCSIISQQSEILGIKEIRNVQTAIIYEEKGTYLNYEFYAKHDKHLVTEVEYKNHKLQSLFANRMLQGAEELFYESMNGKEVQEWYEYQKTTNQFADSFLENAQSLNYYFYSLGPVALGISSYTPLSDEEINLFKRFRNVFDMAYRRFLDIEKAEFQARESQIELALERVRARTMAMLHSNELAETVAVMFEQFKALGEEPERMAIEIVNEKKHVFDIWATQHGGSQLSESVQISLDEPHVMKKMYKAWKEKTKSITIDLQGNELEAYFQFLKKMGLPVQRKIFGKRRVQNVATFSKGILTIITPEPRPQETIQLLERFAAVFDGTYTRFFDLQNAEAQAREGQIEGALERVRSTSLAMYNSMDLSKVVFVVFTELVKLDARLDRCLLLNVDPKKLDITWYLTGKEGLLSNNGFLVPDNTHPSHQAYLEGWRAKRKKWQYLLGGDEKQRWDAFGFSQTGLAQLPDFIKADMSSVEAIHLTISSDVFGCLIASSLSPLSEAHAAIVDRFTSVFNQAYTRFLDLQRAEAQAREAQIEAALERVRAQAMAMHQTEDLGKTIMIYYEQLDNLIDTTIVRCGAGLLNKENTIAEMSTASKSPDGEIYYVRGKIEMQGHSLLDNTYEHWLKQEEYSHVLHGNDISKYYQYITNQVAIPGNTGDDDLYFYFPMFNEGSFYVVTNNEVPEDELQIFRRFGTVLSLTYRRFNDLQRAEAQAREAQIEAALERVRSRSMGMQKSEELKEVIKIVYQQLILLKINLDHAGFVVDYKPKGDWHFWIADERDIPSQITHPWFESVWANQFFEAKENGEDLFATNLNFEEKNKFYNELLSHVSGLPEASRDFYLSCPGLAATTVLLENVALYIENFSGISYTAEENKILIRFARVFEQTYTRFLDLQKAEGQAREAQIEAALEKVRSRTMAMRGSDELLDVATILFQQVKALGVPQWNCGFNIWENGDEEFIYYPGTPDGIISQSPCRIPLNEHPVFKSFDESRKRGDELFIYEKEGEMQRSHYQYMLSLPGVGDVLQSMLNAGFEFPVFQIDHVVNFAYGNLIFITYEHFPEMHEVFKRFAKVFEQTYTRFLDLQKAEAQAREATKRASVDRVRGEIASMRTTKDLERITPLVWSELTTLGVPFIRSGVFIMEEENHQIQVHLSTPYGKAIAAFQLNYEASVQSRQIVSHWREMKIFKDHMDETAFAEYTKNLVQQGALTGDEKYVTENHPTDLYLHFLPFAQGMLYVGNDAPLHAEELQLVQDLADAFSTAYARYEDFNKLEAAKLQVDKALVNLKQAQQQLVQSEKMASLGELTAGIAHEIQNPLNFVNNFSEVSSELVDEMNEELGKGNLDDAIEIATDLKQNLEKITHHGKRAGEIVKGMLQHSRTSSGQKELTDINALADEYLRLAYHGLRAKDKSFNSKMETDFDPVLPKIEVVPQDIGRVILNLITNAFYAVNEKSKQGISRYEPTVSVSTKKKENAIEISVKDNGNGVPEHIKEKIFQPFFTTKPTGQGTGLGLSLSYDIVKVHRGELKVETKEGAGSEFVILLPI